MNRIFAGWLSSPIGRAFRAWNELSSSFYSTYEPPLSLQVFDSIDRLVVVTSPEDRSVFTNDTEGLRGVEVDDT